MNMDNSSKDSNNRKYVDRRVRICVECGSSNTDIYGKYTICKECKAVRHYKVKRSTFHLGDMVRIVEQEMDSNIVYKIIKIKKSKEGTALYIMKSELDNKEVRYYEGNNSYLEKVILAKTKSKNVRN